MAELSTSEDLHEFPTKSSSTYNFTDLNNLLTKNLFIKGDEYSAEDGEEFDRISEFALDAHKYPAICKWALRISCLTGKSLGLKENPVTKGMLPDEDEENETPEEKEAARARHERMALEKSLQEEQEEGMKEKSIEKSLVTLEVHAVQLNTNMQKLWNKIKHKEIDGLTWVGECKVDEIAFGLSKLTFSCTIVDSMVLLQDITDCIETIENVKSVQCLSMNKI